MSTRNLENPQSMLHWRPKQNTPQIQVMCITYASNFSLPSWPHCPIIRYKVVFNENIEINIQKAYFWKYMQENLCRGHYLSFVYFKFQGITFSLCIMSSKHASDNWNICRYVAMWNAYNYYSREITTILLFFWLPA